MGQHGTTLTILLNMLAVFLVLLLTMGLQRNIMIMVSLTYKRPSQDIINLLPDIGPVMLTDYFHEDYYSFVEQVMSSDPNVPVSYQHGCHFATPLMHLSHRSLSITLSMEGTISIALHSILAIRPPVTAMQACLNFNSRLERNIDFD
jgi:hypothetical protein